MTYYYHSWCIITIHWPATTWGIGKWGWFPCPDLFHISQRSWKYMADLQQIYGWSWCEVSILNRWDRTTQPWLKRYIIYIISTLDFHKPHMFCIINDHSIWGVPHIEAMAYRKWCRKKKSNGNLPSIIKIKCAYI